MAREMMIERALPRGLSGQDIPMLTLTRTFLNPLPAHSLSHALPQVGDDLELYGMQKDASKTTCTGVEMFKKTLVSADDAARLRENAG